MKLNKFIEIFSLFKKEPVNLHEPIRLQIEDIKKLDPAIGFEVLIGLDCDSLPKATGPFGTLNNPIPVNGMIGEIKYLGKLRGKTGHGLFFHRIGSTRSTASEKPIDIFEIVCHDGTQWSKIYLDAYHPRRSNKCPAGFRLVPFNEQLKMDIPFAYGVDFFVSDFPYALPELLEKAYGKAFSKRANEWLGEYKFEKPFEKNSAQSNDKNMGQINETFKDEYLGCTHQSRTNSESKPDSNEAFSLYNNGITLLKQGEYEEALNLFFKAKSINKDIKGLSAHILISRFWASEFEIEYEYEVLFDSFSNEMKKNPKIIELYEARAWLCYHILNNVEDLDESKYVFYKTQSETDFSVCISSYPNDMKFYSSRSLLFRNTKEFSKALQDINKAIDLAPENSGHYKDRADIFKSIGKLKDSIKDIATAISLCKEERLLREYKNLEESLIISIKESITKKEIKSHFESISNSTLLQPDDLVFMYERDPSKANMVVTYQISKINSTNITVQKMAVNGEPLKAEQRVVTMFKFEDFVNNKSSLLIDETNDKDDWPKTLPDAIKQLLEIYDNAELKSICNMTWSEFQIKYFTYGGLDQWVRNNFGLWRGNYDLLLDSKIDKIYPDNASISILYHFWEYVVDNIKPKAQR